MLPAMRRLRAMTGQSALLLPPEQAVATISATIVEELQPALERLEEFKALSEDWDSYGAAAISPRSIGLARDIAAEVVSNHALSIRPEGYTFDVVPTPDGGVQLEWTVSEQHLEVVIDPQGTFGYLLVSMSDGDRRSTTADDVSRDVVLQIAFDLLKRQDG
jgi:hypothetical protein